jgi:hypothetical protein
MMVALLKSTAISEGRVDTPSGEDGLAFDVIALLYALPSGRGLFASAQSGQLRDEREKRKESKNEI